MKVNWRMLLGSSKSTILTSLFAVIAVIALLSLAGCGGSGGGTSATPTLSAQTPAAQVAATVSGVEQPRMIGNDRRMAVVYECWYALNSAYKLPDSAGPHGEPTMTGSSISPHNTVSNWHYLSDDTNALQQVKSIVGSDSSGPNWTVAPTAGPGAFGPGDDYAFKQALSPDNRHLGRGGQCTYFTCLVLYRSLGGFRFSTAAKKPGQEAFWWGDLTAGAKSGKYPDATSAQPGDVVFKLGSPNHVGICVNNFNNGKLEIVDSNFCGYGSKTYAVGSYQGSYNSEIIGRHTVDVKSEGYKLFSGDKNKNPLGWY